MSPEDPAQGLPSRRSALRFAVSRAFGVDVRSLAACRMTVGTILLLDLIERARFLGVWYGEAGLVPRVAVRQALGDGIWYIHPHFLSGSLAVVALLLAVHMGAAIALAAGWYTRLATLLCFVLTVSLDLRNPAINQAGDAMLRLILFWGMFVPWGGAWSHDVRSGRYHLGASWVATIGTAALLLQLAAVYWITVLLKLSPPWVADGSAVWMALSIDGIATPLGSWLREFPVPVLRGLTWGTMLLEVVGPFLVFVSLGGRLRLLAFVLFAGLHVGMGATLHLGTFQWIPIAGWLVVIPGWFWDRLGILPAPELDEKGPAGTVWWERRTLGWVAIGFTAIMTWQNAGTVVRSLEPPSGLRRALATAGLYQYWGMFAPYPGRTDGWLVARGTWADGRTADLLLGTPVTWAKPAHAFGEYPNQHWRKYILELHSGSRRAYRGYLSRYLCTHPSPLLDSPAFTSPHLVELYWVMELTRLDWTVAAPVPIALDIRQCSDVTPPLTLSPQPDLPSMPPVSGPGLKADAR